MIELLKVFQNAAPPQKAVFVLLMASLLLTLVSGALEWRRGRVAASQPLAVSLGLAAALLGLLVGAMNAFHMMDTTMRLAISPSAKDLAPGVMEVAALVGLGALSGLIAMAVKAALAASQTSRSSRR